MSNEPARIAQINLNRSADAHELMLQSMIELKIGLVVICEPYKCIPHNDWCSDPADTVALYRNGNIASPSLRTLAVGRGFVLPECRKINVIGVYAPPSWPIDEYNNMLSNISLQLRKVPETNNNSRQF